MVRSRETSAEEKGEELARFRAGFSFWFQQLGPVHTPRAPGLEGGGASL
jgi:hypothetical protein